MNNDYWKECIETAFAEAGITATPEQIASVASDVEGSHENYGMAFGHDAIPNPLQSEIRKLEDRIISANEETDNIRRDFVKNICLRHNCDPAQVKLEGNGHATIQRR